MPKAYSYLRFSSSEQASGHSDERQTSSALAWSKRTGIPLDEELVFSDRGRSAYRGQQFAEGALGRFIELVRNGTIERRSYLLIEDLDRFSRENPMTSTSRLFELAQLGIIIVTTSDGFEYSVDTLSGGDIGRLLMLVLKLSQSHLESARKSEMVSKAWAKKRALARNGEHILTGRCPGWLKVQDGKFVPIPDRVEVVRRIFDETIQGYGRRAIARRLNAADPYVPPFRNDEPGRKRPVVGWQPSSVAKILNNEAVFGVFQPGVGSSKFGNRRPEGPPIPDYYPRIVEKDVFWQAYAASKGRRKHAAGRPSKTGSHILRGLARCGSCEGPMHIENKGRAPNGWQIRERKQGGGGYGRRFVQL